MDFLNWYDWITPTNPQASLFLGIMFTLLLGIFVWFETKRRQAFVWTMVTGMIVTSLGVYFLQWFGYYG
ncbi:hypothetical protein N780_15945 [Pontibacillus chungwhensis BH030062]|uniref:DUF2759 domain-containing protein n=1 Tax=Pontibacillus chungwhensis BH030062 TaxID=1385513 RepID=A0A0A2UUN4_9BACI|nr:hypothetical protein [Pontibacillus chungwhensis]KGP92007.1 hypothetical protein N780_15945 [Pontibacillus chungwhensis BH030062]